MLRKNSNKGTALISVLMISVMIAGLSATYVIRSVQSSQATRYNLDGKKALSIAEGGLDFSMNQLAAQADGNVSGQLGGGAYGVTVTSPCSGLYTLVSTGIYDGVTRRIEATVQILNLDPLSPPGAFSIIDDNSRAILNAKFCGNAFILNGHDTNINGSAGSQPAVAGISVFNDAYVSAIVADLHANGMQNDNILGSGSNPSVVNMAATSKLTFSSVADFADQMLLVANTVLPGYNASGASWGTASKPQITYVQGNCKIGGASSGAGILLVDGTISITGNFDFNGLIVMTGKCGSPFDFSSKGKTNVHGSVILLDPQGNLNTVTTVDLDVRGNINIYYSSEGLSMAWKAVNGADKPTVISWRRTR